MMTRLSAWLKVKIASFLFWLAGGAPFALLALLVLAPRPAAADCHVGHFHVNNYGHAYQQHYTPEVVIATPVATLLVPAFSFQYLPAVQPAVAPRQAAPAAGGAHPPVPRPRAPVDDWPAAPTAALASGSNSLAAVFTRHGCTSCHGENGKNTPLFDGSGQLLASADRQTILDQVEEDLMPPKARTDPSQALSVEEKNTLRAFLAR